MYGVSGAQQQGFQVFRGSTFSISCSTQPQYPGGSFLLSSSTHNYTQPAVNHSAHFLFLAAEPAHQGSYSCVYHDLSSESRLLSVTVTDPEPFIIRAVVLPLTQLLVTIGLYFYCKATRGRRPSDRRTLSWIMMTWVFLLKRKELREQSSSSKELLSHTWRERERERETERDMDHLLLLMMLLDSRLKENKTQQIITCYNHVGVLHQIITCYNHVGVLHQIITCYNHVGVLHQIITCYNHVGVLHQIITCYNHVGVLHQIIKCYNHVGVLHQIIT
ncbi:hypothetical protein F7725_012267 [Dissostichus mawsoni]|uniref:Immunoglobulin domain-containing protein n=1 Tax=Dissostichus mawsoni TaxID=36200 RepID=A0A7J5YM76_DISMA|nr:hypothetical protein F7725_012267 [Dissostichus mawsoni]